MTDLQGSSTFGELTCELQGQDDRSGGRNNDRILAIAKNILFGSSAAKWRIKVKGSMRVDHGFCFPKDSSGEPGVAEIAKQWAVKVDKGIWKRAERSSEEGGGGESGPSALGRGTWTGNQA